MPSHRGPTTGRILLAILALVSLLGSVLGPGAPVLAQQDTGGSSGATRDYGKSTTVGDPLSAANGAYHFSMPLLSLGGPMELDFELFYRSDYSRFNSHLPGLTFWWRPFADALADFTLSGTDPTQYATVYLPDGDQVSFKKDTSGAWVLTDAVVSTFGGLLRDNLPRTRYQLEDTGDFLYLLDPGEERVAIFLKWREVSGERHFRPVRILDRNGNQLTYTYASSSDNRPTRIEDGLGRSLDLTYENVGAYNTFLKTVTDQGGRRVVLTHEAQGADNDNQPTLRSVTDPLNQTTTFSYAGAVGYFDGLITRQILPLGNVPFSQTYELKTLDGSEFARVTSQRDALGNVTTLSYSTNGNVVTETRPDGTTRTYEHYSSHGFPRSLTDPTGRTATMGRSADEQLTSVTDRLGDTTSATYHAETGKLASLTDTKGGTTSFSYTAQDQSFTNPLNSEQVPFTFYNQTRIQYPDGASEQFTYDAAGNLLTQVDEAGQTWRYTYNSRGQVLTETTPTSGVTTMTYHADGTRATSAESGTATTTFSYDAFKRLARVTHPDGSTVQIAYNANDEITSMADERGNSTSYSYDANGNLLSITDAAGKSTQFGYDALDRLVRVTDPLGKVATVAYDALGRPASHTDPSGIALTFGYDPRGWVNGVSQAGKVWQTGYDDEGIVASRTSPAGRTWTHQADKLGFPAAVTNALGQTTTLSWDAMGRLTSVTDPLGQTTSFGYDGRGLLAGSTAPGAGTVSYQRNGLGLITQITDARDSVWRFTYTPMGMVQSQTDPLGQTWQHSYDNQGQISQTTYPDGSTATYTYDQAGNVTQVQYPGGPELQYTYDALDRLAGTDGLQLTLDALGRVTNTSDLGTSFGASYDDADRLRTATYQNGAFTASYTYDAATGLLSSVTDSLTGAQVAFTYDADQHITGITRSNGVNATFTWDGAAWLTRLQDGALLDLQYTRGADGQVTQMNLTAPLDPVGGLGAGTSAFTYDAASQVSSSGYAYDQRGRLTAAPGHTFAWDGAARLARVDDVTLAYNGMGDLRTRTQGQQSTHFYYNHALGLAPLVAEKDEATGQVLRYYVWTPDGELLYMIDAAGGNKVSFYHFDHLGSTLALTDQAGQVSDAYAYDPYGRLLAHEGNSLQPFSFVGRLGVRQEGGSGTLYQMRARYYDAVTARFLTRDPLWPNPASPPELNPYQYAAQDPLRFTDPEGAFLHDLLTFIPALPSLRDTYSKHLKFWEPYKKKIAWLEYGLWTVPNGSKVAKWTGVAGMFGKLWARGVTPINGTKMAKIHKLAKVGRYSRTAVNRYVPKLGKLSRISRGTLRTFSTVKTVAKGAVLVGGAIAVAEIVDRTVLTSAAENSRLVGEEKRSWNPITRGTSWLGSKMGDWWYGRQDDCFKTPPERRKRDC